MSEALRGTMEDGPGQDDPAAVGRCLGLTPAVPGHLEAPYSEAWGYFHLAPASLRHRTGHWATCRLCGELVRRGPGWHAGTSALWSHLKSAHRQELEKSSAPRSPPGLPRPDPAAVAEGDWARLLEQMGALAVRGSRRERELERREAAVEQGERALERRRRALQEEVRAAAQARQELQAEREALQARLREISRREGALGWATAPSQVPVKEDPENRNGCVITKVLL